MILEVQPSLEERLVRLISERGTCSVTEIEVGLQSAGVRYSKQAIYKQLKKLEEGAVITKLKTFYTMNLGWVLDMQQFARHLSSTYLDKHRINPLIDLHPRRSWEFRDLWSLHDFLMHLMLVNLLKSEDELIWLSSDYPWYVLADRVKQSTVRRALRSLSKQLTVVLGKSCFLSELCAQDLPQDIFQPFFADSLDAENGTASYLVIGDRIIRVEITQKLANSIEEFFLSNRVASDISRDKTIDLLKLRSKVTVRFEQNVLKSQRLSKKFLGAISGDVQLECREARA